MLSACETVSSDDLTELENEVADLRTRLDAADARSAEAEAAAARCTEVCEATSERTDRMLQQSLQK
jgi:Alanine-zipper, major outer membrane lipoprotein